MKKKNLEKEKENETTRVHDQLRLIQQSYIQQKRKAIIVIEGVDTAGKGGLIRRLAWSMDPRSLKVWPISAPNAIEKEAHYLSRFWNKLPGPGEIAVFDRSWYGRVLVEKIEHIIDNKTSVRAYEEINEFEQMLTNDDVKVIKILLKISKKEQAIRLRQRLNDPGKNWKLTLSDLRNRSLWGKYESAYKKMLSKNSKPKSEWYVIDSDEKEQSRKLAMDYLIKSLSEGISLKPLPISKKIVKLINLMN